MVNSEKDPAKRTESGNLYHKQMKPNRSRREPVHKLDSGVVLSSPQKTTDNPARQSFIDSIKRFVFFSLAMIILLFLAIKGLRMIWAIRDSKMMSYPPPPPKESVERPVPVVNNLPTGNRPDAATTTTDKESLDTEAIRKAVFLAKRAKALEDQGQLTQAIARYQDALDVWPYLTQVWGQLGRLYLQTKDYNKAQVALQKAVENDPQNAEILNDLGVSYLYLSLADKALDVFAAAVDVDPTYAPSYFNIALSHLALGQKDQARDRLNQYLRMKPADARALRELAFLDAAKGDYVEAMKSIEKAISESPDWALLYFDAAATAALLGEGDRAIAYLEKAEPLASPGAVYEIYQEPAFKEIRLSEIGKEFEKNLADRAREIIASHQLTNAAPEKTSQPISSQTQTQP